MSIYVKSQWNVVTARNTPIFILEKNVMLLYYQSLFFPEVSCMISYLNISIRLNNTGNCSLSTCLTWMKVGSPPTEDVTSRESLQSVRDGTRGHCTVLPKTTQCMQNVNKRPRASRAFNHGTWKIASNFHRMAVSRFCSVKPIFD